MKDERHGASEENKVSIIHVSYVHDVWHGGDGEGDGAVPATLLDGEEGAAGGAHGQREYPRHADVAVEGVGGVGELSGWMGGSEHWNGVSG